MLLFLWPGVPLNSPRFRVFCCFCVRQSQATVVWLVWVNTSRDCRRRQFLIRLSPQVAPPPPERFGSVRFQSLLVLPQVFVLTFLPKIWARAKLVMFVWACAWAYGWGSSNRSCEIQNLPNFFPSATGFFSSGSWGTGVSWSKQRIFQAEK